MSDLKNIPLGKKSAYISQYKPDLLFPIPRTGKRDEIGIRAALPFKGVDIWNAYEISWLNRKGKPVVAVGEFIIPCESPHLIESKSFKLYLNSFNNTQFDSLESVQSIMQQDLSNACGSTITARLYTLTNAPTDLRQLMTGIHLDEQDISCDTYMPAPELLSTSEQIVTETLHSDLLKSNCLVTGQPDWGSVQITYTGNQISHAGLLRYIVSLRNHNEFHEQCVERMYMDISRQCRPTSLSVYARYTRRGGLDINPWRGSSLATPSFSRLIRQ